MSDHRTEPSALARTLLIRIVLVAVAVLALLVPTITSAGSAPAKDDHGAESHSKDDHGESADGDGHEDSKADKGETHPIMSAADYFSDVGLAGYGLFARSCQGCHGSFMDGTDHGADLVRIALEMDYRKRKAFHATVHEHARDPKYGRAIAATGALEFNQIELIAKYMREFGEWRADRLETNGKDDH